MRKIDRSGSEQKDPDQIGTYWYTLQHKTVVRITLNNSSYSLEFVK